MSQDIRFAYLRTASRRLFAVVKKGADEDVVEVPGVSISGASRFDVRVTWAGRKLFVWGLRRRRPLVWEDRTWRELPRAPFDTTDSRQTWRVHPSGAVTVVQEEPFGALLLGGALAYLAAGGRDWQMVSLPRGLVVRDIAPGPKEVLRIAGGTLAGTGGDAATHPFLGEIRDAALVSTPPRVSAPSSARLREAGVDTFRRIIDSRWGTVVVGSAGAILDCPQDFVLLEGEEWRLKRFRELVRTCIDLPNALAVVTTDGGIRRTSDFGRTWKTLRYRSRLARTAQGSRSLVVHGAAYSAGRVALAFSFYDWRNAPGWLVRSGLLLADPDLQELDLIDVADEDDAEILAVTSYHVG